MPDKSKINTGVVGPNTRISLYFSMRLENGELVDSTGSERPATFVYGDGNILPNFEKLLLGLKSGDKRSFVLPAKSAFGDHNPQNVHAIPRTQFAREMDLVEGLLIGFQDAAGEELPGLIKSVNEQFVLVDFNHPLSGKEIIFEVEILEVLHLNAQMLVEWIEQNISGYQLA